METRIIRVDAACPDDSLLLPAALALRNGQLVAFPTETVYGLGANALDPLAVAAIFKAKGRPGDNPLIVHVANLNDLLPLVSALPKLAELLFHAFAPGPLTLVLPKSRIVPDLVTAGLDTVAVRIPAHPVARRLIELSGVPVAAPSANRSGRPSPIWSWHVEADLAGRIPFIIDAGDSPFGLESTVVDVTGDVPVILRPGTITARQISDVTGIPVTGILDHDDGSEVVPRSPGTKYRHYAPKARVLVVEGPDPLSRAHKSGLLASELLAQQLKIGFFGCRQFLDNLPVTMNDTVQMVAYGIEPDAAMAGSSLFDALRRLDRTGVAVIIAEGLPEQGVGAAYMNRLIKASSAWQPEGAEHGR